MTTKHTPGPWHVGEFAHGDIDYIGIGGSGAAIARSLVTACIRLNEAEANARLMSAAPDLLAALEFCVENLARPEGAAAREARAAIAKATGDHHAS